MLDKLFNNPIQEIDEIIKDAKIQHYFTPSEDNNMFCGRCDEYLTDQIHKREIETPKEITI